MQTINITLNSTASANAACNVLQAMLRTYNSNMQDGIDNLQDLLNDSDKEDTQTCCNDAARAACAMGRTLAYAAIDEALHSSVTYAQVLLLQAIVQRDFALEQAFA